MRRILVIGTNSFIGANFRKFSKNTDIEEISLIENDPEEIDFSKYDVVLHLAAIVHQSKKIAECEYFRVNRDLCLRVAEKAQNDGIRQFVYLSTLKVYGDYNPGTSMRDENSACFPDDDYGKSKYEAEIGLKKLDNENFTVSIIRTPLVYGVGVKANMHRLIKLVDYCPVLPFGSVENKRNFTYIENLVGFIDCIIEKKASGIFITTDDKAMSTTDLVNQLARNLNRKSILFKLPGIIIKIGYFLKPEIFKGLFGSLEVDNEKTKAKLDYTPPFTTEEGLRKTISSYRLGKLK